MVRWLVAMACLVSGMAEAQTLRVALFNASLYRDAPGILLKDLEGDDPQIDAVIGVIQTVRPDILVLNEIDYDGGLTALTALRDRIDAGAGAVRYDHLFAAPSNTGEPSGLDLNGDGEATGPADAWGFGQFPGQFGMAVLSRHPIGAARTFQTLRWADLEGALLPVKPDGSPFVSADVAAARRLSSKSHWDVAVETPEGPLHLFVSHPTPPVFDGPEDLNGRRNHDEIVFWVRYLDGWAPEDDAGEAAPRADAPFVILGDLNADPVDGDGIQAGIRALLDHPLVQDPGPESAGAAAAPQTGANVAQTGPPAQDTADFRDDPGPGNLRADYALPAAALTLRDAGVHWPAPGEPGADQAAAASDHRLVWVDIAWP